MLYSGGARVRTAMFNNKRLMTTPLLDALIESATKKHAAFYAPGHKQGKSVDKSIKDFLGKKLFVADLPELPELDNLFAPVGVIAAAQNLAAEVFGADKTWFLINGSTCGIMAAILATCTTGDKIILPRNIHQSAIAGLVLAGAMPIFINPEYNIQSGLAFNVTPEAVKQALKEHPDAKAVMMLHPTYQGVCSDLKAIAKLAHQYNIPLLVDEAHGAHFGFHEYLPPSAMSMGADLSVQSTHKVLSAMTQASMLHIQGDRLSDRQITKALQLVQSTSPSYLLLASLDAAREQMATQGKELMNRTLNLAAEARSKLEQISNLSVFQPAIEAGCQHFDSTRLTLHVASLGITGYEADEILHEQLQVTCELPLLQHLTFIISLGNTSDDIQQLIQGCKNLSQAFDYPGQDKTNSVEKLSTISYQLSTINYPPSTLTPKEAYFSLTKTIPMENAQDCWCGELICPYPPGIPLLIPGEIITAEAIEYLKQVLAAGGTITGCKDSSLKTIEIIEYR